MSDTNLSSGNLGSEGRDPTGNKRKRSDGDAGQTLDLTKVRSPTFKEFTYNAEKGRWVCNRCQKAFKHPKGGGSTTLTRHLETAHKDWKQTGELKETDVLETAVHHTDCQEISEEGFQDHVLAFMAKTNQPFNLVESKEFRQLISYCSSNNPACRLPSSRTVRRWIDKRYLEEQEKLKKELADVPGKISFQVDGWTSRSNHAFQGVIGSWISTDWTLKMCLLDMTKLSRDHSGVNMCHFFCTVLEKFDIWNKLLALTGDSASNIDSLSNALEEICRARGISFKSAEHRVRCLAHILNLVCKDVIKSAVKSVNALPPSEIEDQNEIEMADEEEIDEHTDDEDESQPSVPKPISLLHKIRKGVVAIRSSVKRLEAYESFCIASQIKKKSLLPDIQTRWNSTYRMLNRLHEMKMPFISTVNFIPELKAYNLSSEEWSKVDKLIDVLKPFDVYTREISGASTTIADTAAVYQILFEHLENLARDTLAVPENMRGSSLVQICPSENPQWIIDAANAGWIKLQKYYPKTEGLAYVVATVLDPRRKLAYFRQVGWSEPDIEKAEKAVIDLWKTEYKDNQPEGGESQSSPYSEDLSDILYRKMCEASTENSRIINLEDELTRFLSEKVVNPRYFHNSSSADSTLQGALLWWKMNETQYPQLSKMARDYLAISATSVPIERTFSLASDICRPKRYCLNAQTINKLMCLKDWIGRDAKAANDVKHYVEAFKDKVLDDISDEE